MIELEEWSGPTSPKFQYRIKLTIEPSGLVHYEEEGANAVAKKSSTMSKDASDALWRELDEKHALDLGGDLIVDRKRKGVSFNRLSIEREEKKMVLEYTLASLDDARRAVISAIKKAARAAVT